MWSRRSEESRGVGREWVLIMMIIVSIININIKKRAVVMTKYTYVYHILTHHNHGVFRLGRVMRSQKFERVSTSGLLIGMMGTCNGAGRDDKFKYKI